MVEAQHLNITTECRHGWRLRLFRRLYPAYLIYQVRCGRMTPDEATQKYADFICANIRYRVDHGRWYRLSQNMRGA